MFKQLCAVQKKHTLKRNQMERHMNILTKVYFAGRGERNEATEGRDTLTCQSVSPGLCVLLL